MKNRAKCKKCNSVVESFHSTDYVECKCGAISVSGGDAMYCAAIDWLDFVRVDDNDREIVPTIMPHTDTNNNDVKPLYTGKKTRKELIDGLEGVAIAYDNLPLEARDGYVTNDDLMGLIKTLVEILKQDN